MGNTLPFNPAKEKATCGSVTGTGAFPPNETSTGKAMSWQAMREMVVTLMPAAHRYNGGVQHKSMDGTG